MDRVEVAKQTSSEIEQLATQRAKYRANVARWSLEVAVLAFAILIAVMIMLYQDVKIEIVAAVAVVGLAMVWLEGWRRGRQLYPYFYDEELSKLQEEPTKVAEETAEEPVEDIEDKVRRALRDRWR